MNIKNKLPVDLLEFAEHLPPIVWNLIIAVAAISASLIIIKVIVTQLFKFYARKETPYSFFRSVIVNLDRAIILNAVLTT